MQMRYYAQWVTVCMSVAFLVVACTVESFLNDPIISPTPTQITQPDLSSKDATPVLWVTSSPEGAAIPIPVSGKIGLADTLVLYTTVEQVAENSTPTTTGSNTLPVEYWALKGWPHLPIFDQPVFDTFYGEVAKAQGIALYFLNFQPQLSPNGRYLLLPGIGGYTPPDGDLGIGLWLVDLAEGTLRQLLPQAKIATWSPASDAITYVEDETLYTLSITEGATSIPLFSHPNIWELYAHWSPDGRWIATVTVTGTQSEPDVQGSPELTNTYWLVPISGEPARELAVKQDFAMEYSTGEMAWSPDAQFLLMRSEIFNLTGEKVATGFSGSVTWLPIQPQLLVNGDNGLRLMTISGEEIASISDAFAQAWAFSPNGMRLAYSRPDEDGHTSLWIFDFATGENQFVGSIAAGNIFPLRWSGDGKYLIIGGGQDDKSLIWTIEAQSNSLAELILENALLVEVVRNLSP